MIQILIVVMAVGTWGGFAAETNAPKGLFVVRVETLRTVEQKGEAARKKKDVAEVKSEVEDFAVEQTSSDTSAELRVQQIESMNGGAMMRVGGAGRSSGGPRGVGRALDFLLPKGRPLLSRNPNARRDPLRVLEE